MSPETRPAPLLVVTDLADAWLTVYVAEPDLGRVRLGQAAQVRTDAGETRPGKVTFIDFHLVVPGAMSVADAHDICDRIELALKETVEGALVTIHVEPEMKAKAQGVAVL